MKKSFSNKNAKIQNEEKIKFDKIWGNTMRGPLQTRRPKFKLFNCLSSTHQIFRIGI